MSLLLTQSYISFVAASNGIAKKILWDGFINVQSMQKANRPDHTERLNETATNSDPSKNQNSIGNPSIVIGDTNIQSISPVNSPMLLRFTSRKKSRNSSIFAVQSQS